MSKNYVMYHNPDTMGREFREIAMSGRVLTNKETTAERAANEGAVIWCVGRRSGVIKRYFLYQRIVDTRCDYAKQHEIEKGNFRIILSGKPTMPADYEKDITDEPYFPEVKKLLSLGLQPLVKTEVISAFESELTRVSGK